MMFRRADAAARIVTQQRHRLRTGRGKRVVCRRAVGVAAVAETPFEVADDAVGVVEDCAAEKTTSSGALPEYLSAVAMATGT